MKEDNIKVVNLDLNDILPNRFQPRIKFNEESIVELSDSIKEHGLIQPIVVRPISDKYEIIAGERRYKACALADLKTIPAIVLDLNDKDSIEVALIENLQRKDLSPIEEAISYKKTLDMGVMTQEQLASKLGRSQSTIANKIRLLNLCDEVQEALMEEKISERHARSLLKVSSSEIQKKLLYRIVRERITVRKLDEIIDNKDFDSKDDIDVINTKEENVENDYIDKNEKESKIINNEIIEKNNDENESKDEEKQVKELDNDKITNIDLTNVESYDDLSSIEKLTILLEKDKKENEDNMNNNMQNLGGQINYNVPTPKNNGSVRFIINQVDDENNNEEQNSGFRLNNEPQVQNKTPDIFTSRMNNSVISPAAQQNSIFTNSNQSVQNTNATSIFGNISFHNDKESNVVEEKPATMTPLDLVNNDKNLNETADTIKSDNSNATNTSSMFSNLMNNDNSSDIIDKQTLNSFLDPSYIDGEKQEQTNDNNSIDEMVFAKFIDPDYEEKTDVSNNSNNETEKITFTKEPVQNMSTLSEEKAEETSSVLTSSDLSDTNSFEIGPNIEKPDLMAPMSSAPKSIEASAPSSFVPSSVNPFAVQSTPEPNNSSITPDNTIEKEVEEEEEEVPVQNQNSSIFVTASNPNVSFEAPTSPIIDNPSASKLLNVEPKQPEEETTVETSDNSSLDSEYTPVVDENDNKSDINLTEDSNINNNASLNIEPIIITDYTKQYDPVIPDQKPVRSKPEFKDILNLIRNLSDQIEKLGYSIDTEEIDLDGSYQVIFNIDK